MVPVTGPAAFASVITAVFTPSTIAAATAFVMASAIRSVVCFISFGEHGGLDRRFQC